MADQVYQKNNVLQLTLCTLAVAAALQLTTPTTKNLDHHFLNTHCLSPAILKGWISSLDLPPPFPRAKAPQISPDIISHLPNIVFNPATISDQPPLDEERLTIAQEILFPKNDPAPTQPSSAINPKAPEIVEKIVAKVTTPEEVAASLKKGDFENISESFMAVAKLAALSDNYRPSYRIYDWGITTVYVESRFIDRDNPLRYNDEPLADHLYLYGSKIVSHMERLGHVVIQGEDYFAPRYSKGKRLPSHFERFRSIIDSLNRSKGKIVSEEQRKQIAWVKKNVVFAGAAQVYLAMDKLPSLLETISDQDSMLALQVEGGLYYAIHNAGPYAVEKLADNIFSHRVGATLDSKKLCIFGIDPRDNAATAIYKIAERQKLITVALMENGISELSDKKASHIEISQLIVVPNGLEVASALPHRPSHDNSDGAIRVSSYNGPKIYSLIR